MGRGILAPPKSWTRLRFSLADGTAQGRPGFQTGRSSSTRSHGSGGTFSTGRRLKTKGMDRRQTKAAPLGSTFDNTTPTERYGLSNSSTFPVRSCFHKFTKGGWDVSYWGGNQLDRFSRYSTSFLTAPRLHGIPPGTDFFDAIATANVHYGFNVMDLVKIEGMYAYARARNLDESLRFKKFDGLELNFNTPGPMGTLMQGTVSYALDGNIARYNSRWAVYILLFKPLH